MCGSSSGKNNPEILLTPSYNRIPLPHPEHRHFPVQVLGGHMLSLSVFLSLIAWFPVNDVTLTPVCVVLRDKVRVTRNVTNVVYKTVGPHTPCLSHVFGTLICGSHGIPPLHDMSDCSTHCRRRQCWHPLTPVLHCPRRPMTIRRH